jgi:hypothetical protein
MLPESEGVGNRRGRKAGDPRHHGVPAGSGQTTALAGGPGPSRRACEEGRGLVVSQGRHSGRGLRTVPCARQLEVREDAVKDGGVVEGGDQFHPAGAARTAQDIRSKARRISAAHVQ